ncbi:hypothetical protein C0V78_02235 [Novosphingobium sp. TH158]|nr:hypothetical protein C0V78_02235 [Novosphingobium sp. TH158]
MGRTRGLPGCCAQAGGDECDRRRQLCRWTRRRGRHLSRHRHDLGRAPAFPDRHFRQRQCRRWRLCYQSPPDLPDRRPHCVEPDVLFLLWHRRSDAQALVSQLGHLADQDDRKPLRGCLQRGEEEEHHGLGHRLWHLAQPGADRLRRPGPLLRGQGRNHARHHLQQDRRSHGRPEDFEVRSLRELRGDSTGVTVVEFALIAPVLIVMLMATYDLGYQLYASSVLQGAIQKVGRDSTIEGAANSTTALDQKVTDQVKMVVPNATMSFSRKAYASFSAVGRPEDFNDVNNNGKCDNGETYEDINGNNKWDTDRGKIGQGGAKDAVLYTVTVTYPRPLAVAKLLGFSNDITLKTETVLRNQPYTTQDMTKVNRKC